MIRRLLVVDSTRRLTAGQALSHPWVKGLAAPDDANVLQPNQERLREFNSLRRVRSAVTAVIVSKLMFRHITPPEMSSDPNQQLPPFLPRSASENDAAMVTD